MEQRRDDDAKHPLYETMSSSFGEPGEWQWLFSQDGRELIDATAKRLKLTARYTNPTSLEPDKPPSAFVRAGASIPVLHDWDTIQVFAEAGRLAEIPRFLRAGEPSEFRLNPTQVRVGIIIAGGPAAGLNMVVDSIVKRHFALARQMRAEGEPGDLRVFGYDGGYDGIGDKRKCLLAPTIAAAEAEGYPMNSVMKIRATDPLAKIEGALVIKSGRGEKPKDNNDSTNLLRRHYEAITAEELDILYVIGGNGTLAWAARLAEYLTAHGPRPIAIIGGPKTMDLDVFFTDATFGFRTAVDQATQFVASMHSDAESTDRVAIVEVFGAGVGRVALHACYDSGVGDHVLIPELVGDEFDEYLNQVLAYLEKRWQWNGHAVLVVAEGALPGFEKDKKRAFAQLMEKIEGRFANKGIKLSDVQTRYLIRATPPSTFDIELCKVTGKLMADTALAGFTGCSVQRWQNDYVLVPLHTATNRENRVPPWDYFLQTFLDRLRINQVTPDITKPLPAE